MLQPSLSFHGVVTECGNQQSPFSSPSLSKLSGKESWDATGQLMKPQERAPSERHTPRVWQVGTPSGRCEIHRNRNFTQESCNHISVTVCPAHHYFCSYPETPMLNLKFYNCPMSSRHYIFSNLLHPCGLATKCTELNPQPQNQRQSCKQVQPDQMALTNLTRPHKMANLKELQSNGGESFMQPQQPDIQSLCLFSNVWVHVCAGMYVSFLCTYTYVNMCVANRRRSQTPSTFNFWDKVSQWPGAD